MHVALTAISNSGDADMLNEIPNAYVHLAQELRAASTACVIDNFTNDDCFAVLFFHHQPCV